jgi:hypothetical protein
MDQLPLACLCNEAWKAHKALLPVTQTLKPKPATSYVSTVAVADTNSLLFVKVCHLSGRSFALSGSTTPPMVTSLLSVTSTSTLSASGCISGMSSATALLRGSVPAGGKQEGSVTGSARFVS